MGWIDNLLSSSLIIYLLIGFGILHIYLKKTGKTFPEVVKEIIEFFKGLNKNE